MDSLSLDIEKRFDQQNAGLRYGMDKATVFGLLLGFGILASVIVLGNVPLATLLQPEALLIVFGGTFTAVLISFSGQALQRALKGLRQCFFHEAFSTLECIDYITDIAAYVRTEGMLALQPLIPNIDIAFVQKGAQLLVDNRPENFIRDSLATDIEVSYRNDMDNSRVFESAGGFAPTMGIIGAVIGLIHVVGSFNNPEVLAHGVASAFVATLYGVAISNLFFLPLAGKLRQRARDEWFRKTLLLEGILSIQSGEHPIVTEEKLRAFLSEVNPQQTSINTSSTHRVSSQQSPDQATQEFLATSFDQPLRV